MPSAPAACCVSCTGSTSRARTAPWKLGSARADDAKELDRLPGAPVLVVTTRYLTADGTAAVSVATYRADTCRLTFGDSGALEISHDEQPQRQAS
ncbi:hypothetical protein SGRI78S_03116 [Streptomyces griseus subsp. griseus]